MKTEQDRILMRAEIDRANAMCAAASERGSGGEPCSDYYVWRDAISRLNEQWILEYETPQEKFSRELDADLRDLFIKCDDLRCLLKMPRFRRIKDGVLTPL